MYKAIMLSALLFGCANLTMDIESVCGSNDFEFPGRDLSVGGQNLNGEFEGTVSQSVEEDLSSSISDIKDIADVELTPQSLKLTAQEGNFDFVRHIVVTAVQDKNNIVIAEATYPKKTNVKSLPLTLKNKDRLTKLLTNGKVLLNVELTGNIPSAPTKASVGMCVGVAGEKSL